MADIKYKHKVIEDNGKIEMIRLLDGYKRVQFKDGVVRSPDEFDLQRLAECKEYLRKPLIVQKPSFRIKNPGRDLSIDDCIDKTIEAGFGSVERACRRDGYFDFCTILPLPAYFGSLKGIFEGRHFFMAGLPKNLENSLKRLAQIRFIYDEIRDLKGYDRDGHDIDLVHKPGATMQEALKAFDITFRNRNLDIDAIQAREATDYDMLHYGNMKQILNRYFDNKIDAGEYRKKVINAIHDSNGFFEEYYGEYKKIVEGLKAFKSTK